LKILGTRAILTSYLTMEIKVTRAQRKKLRIRNLSNLKHAAAEACEMESKKYKRFYDIKISSRQNKNLTQYLRTLSHELFHIAFYVIADVFKKEYTMQSIHEFIQRMEDAMMVHFHVLKEK